MIKNIRFNAGILVLAFLSALAVAPASAKDKWLSISTKNFNIISNADEKDTREQALKLEQFHQVYTTLFRLKDPITVPVTVMVFKSDDSFKPFKPLYNGKPANISGYFQSSEDENLIALDISASDKHPLRVIYHEYTHLMTKTQRQWPLWLREGIAELYSTFEVKKNEVTLGVPISGHVYLLRESRLMPLDALFNVRHESSAYNEREKQGIFYAQSWALTHYLMFGDNSARQPQTVEFVKLIHSGVEPDAAFKQAFKTDFASVEKALRKYIGNSSYSGTIYAMESAEGEKEVSVSQLSEAEVQFYLGNLLLRINRLDEAEAYFKRAAELDPSLARVSEGLGFLATSRNQTDEALKHFEQAINKGSKNYLAYYHYARAIREQAGDNMLHESAKRMADALKASIKLMPGFESSYYLLAFALSSADNQKDAAEILKAAIRLAPQKKHYLLTLAQLQVRMKDYPSAKKTLEPLLTSTDEPGLRSSAESLMETIRTFSEMAAARAARQAADREEAEDAQPDSSAEPEPKSDGSAKSEKNERGGETQVIGRPTVKVAGATVMRGVLVRIDCAGGKWVLVVQVENQLLQFMVSDKEKLEFYSQDPSFDGKISCGTVTKLAFVYYKPIATGKTKFHGDALAVEFTR